ISATSANASKASRSRLKVLSNDLYRTIRSRRDGRCRAADQDALQPVLQRRRTDKDRIRTPFFSFIDKNTFRASRNYFEARGISCVVQFFERGFGGFSDHLVFELGILLCK